MALEAVTLRMTGDAGLEILPRCLPVSGPEEPIGILFKKRRQTAIGVWPEGRDLVCDWLSSFAGIAISWVVNALTYALGAFAILIVLSALRLLGKPKA